MAAHLEGIGGRSNTGSLAPEYARETRLKAVCVGERRTPGRRPLCLDHCPALDFLEGRAAVGLGEGTGGRVLEPTTLQSSYCVELHAMVVGGACIGVLR